MHFDVAIIGGGPAGCTLGTLLRKYNPDLSVAIVEREVFPRDHVGESQLPHLMTILAEMDVWDKVEAADFPIKVGGRYRWGSSGEHWPIDFIPDARPLETAPRPARYEGVRQATAFQVDRAIYDKILLDHCRQLGCTVYENTKVQTVRRDADRVTGFELVGAGDAPSEITARYYVDASGATGLLRRAMGVESDSPTSLRNIAIWDYWQNAEWAEKIGVGGTRILIMSVEWGWLWFIPLGPTRTSLGLVTPAEFAKKSGKKPEELYMEAVRAEPTISRLVRNAEREVDSLRTTSDWSFVADRMAGENWFLAGDAAGFADPILSAGLTLAQNGARKVAYTILEMDRGLLDPKWLTEEYERAQRAQIRSHIRFADYWYSANGHFTELKEYCAEIARDAGIHLEPEQAFRWLGSGGFATDNLGAANLGMFSIGALKLHIQEMTGQLPHWEVEQANVFRLNVEGATESEIGVYANGRIERIRCLIRDNHVLPDYEGFGAMWAALNRESEFPLLMERFALEAGKRGYGGPGAQPFWEGLQVLEAMLGEGWVTGTLDPRERVLRILLQEGKFKFGWYEEGVGLAAIRPRPGHRISVPWDEYQRLRVGVVKA